MMVNNTIEELSLENCSGWACRISCPQLTRLSLRSSSMGSLTLHSCSSLRALDLSSEQAGPCCICTQSQSHQM